MKLKLNLYTVLILAYSLLVCFLVKPTNDTNKTSPLFSITPINQIKTDVNENLKEANINKDIRTKNILS